MMKSYKAYAKVNIFLKITGRRGEYHEILSRFMQVATLYDELSFLPKEKTAAGPNTFLILGDFECATEQNTIYKAYLALKKHTNSASLEKLLQTHAVAVKKKIPAFAGLGGGSSDAATFLKMCNSVLDLGLSLNELATVGLEVGADVPFFIYGYKSANVGGIGEIVEPFEEEEMVFDIYTPDVKISTPVVYKTYRASFYAPLEHHKVLEFTQRTSKEILNTLDAKEANDLFLPAIKAYPKLQSYYTKGYFFSGSGSSFFKEKA